MDDLNPGTSFNPPLHVFGPLCSDLRGVPRPTGALSFKSLDMAGLYLTPAAPSVARFIASCAGTGKAANVVITDHDPQTAKGGHQLLKFTVSRTIAPGDLLLCDYGRRHLACGHGDLVENPDDSEKVAAEKLRQRNASDRVRKIHWKPPSNDGAGGEGDEGEDSEDEEGGMMQPIHRRVTMRRSG